MRDTGWWIPVLMFLVVLGLNVLAWYIGWHVTIPVIGYCEGYGC